MKIGIAGCAGRMGKELLKKGFADQSLSKCQITGGTVHSESAELDLDIGFIAGQPEVGVKASVDFEKLVEESDAIIDFTTPESSLKHAEICAQQKKIFVCGTTGFDEGQTKRLAELAKKTVIFWAPNMSIGVNLVKSLVEKAANLLDESFDIEILEMHHKNKVDAPSGTALMLGEAAASGRGVELDDNAVLSREGHTGARHKGSIGFATLRGGDVVGEHTVMFAGPNERIELSHKSSSRSIYANGAFKAAYWSKDQKPGKLFGMKDLL